MTARVLIVEDEMLVALDLERRLQKLGYDVCGVVATGEDAVAEAARRAPDVVVMDILLPGAIDGIEAAKRIRASLDLPVIYLSANADEKTLQRARATQPASYLLKPFRERELQICIDLSLANHRLQRELKESHALLERRVAERTAELLEANAALQREVAERRQAEELAREQATLLDKARDAIYVVGLDGCVTYWNHGAERLHGVARSDALGRPADALFREIPVLADEDPRAATLRAGEWNGRVRHVGPSGAETLFDARWTLLRDGSGQPSSLLIVATDATEKARMEQQAQRTQRLESVGALAGGIAHDLNNVLTPLLLSAQALAESSLSPGQRQLADVLVTTAGRGAELVKQIHTFVRGTEGALTPFPIEHLARDVSRQFSASAPPGIRVRFSFETGLRPIVGDATRLHLVLMNLCANACEAMTGGGELTLRLENRLVPAEAAARHPWVRPGPFVRVTVSDTGGGIAPEALARVFEPFFTTKAAGEGSGLGLAMVRSIVQQHGGLIEVESAPGRGSRFHVHLPAWVSPDQETAASAAEAAPPQAGHGRQWLVVDDEHAVREMIRSTLEAHGYRVLTASDGIEALASFVVHRADIAGVITDFAMPYLDGDGCARALRRLCPTLPVVVLSGCEAARLPREELAALGVECLAKPITKAQLLSVVASSLQASARGRPA